MEPDKDPREITSQLRIAIRDMLAQRGVTQGWLATEMGVTRSYVSQMINGHKPLTLVFIAHALAVLGADLELRPDSKHDWDFSHTPDLGRSA